MALKLAYIGARSFIKLPAANRLSIVGWDADPSAELAENSSILCLGNPVLSKEKLYLTLPSEWSSLYRLNRSFFKNTLGYQNVVENGAPISVSVVSLDNLLLPLHSYILVINAQGSSFDILQGSNLEKSAIPFVIAELEVQAQYIAAPSYASTCSLMDSLGYQLIDFNMVRTYHVSSGRTGRGVLSHGDFFFFSYAKYQQLKDDDKLCLLEVLVKMGYANFALSLTEGISVHEEILLRIISDSTINRPIFLKFIYFLFKFSSLLPFRKWLASLINIYFDGFFTEITNGFFTHSKDSVRLDRIYHY